MLWGKVITTKMITTKIIIVVFTVAVLGSCESLNGAFTKLSGHMSITSDTLPAANNHDNYLTVLAADGGTAPYKWILVDGGFPLG
jgi:hypothetical protein